jgi:hypothetical protein
MRGLRTFLGLLVVLVALGGYLYFVESKRTPGDDGPKKEKVFTVESDKIEEITVKAESGDETTLKKSGTTWQIVAPVTAKPDDAEVSGLATNLSTLEMQSVVDENAADLKEYGLAEPRVVVTFKAGGQEQTLQIGQKTPPGSDYYAKRGNDKKVFLIASFLDSTFNRKTFDLRDKTAIRVDREKLDAVEIVTPERSLRFAKANGEWQIAAPTPGRADFSAVEGLVGRVAGLQMKSILPGEAHDVKKLGLDKPAATVRLNSGSSQATLEVGGKAEESNVYARDTSRPGVVFTIEGTLLEDFKKDPFEYRQKDLFDARSFNSTRLEIVGAGQTLTFEKTKGKNKEGQDEEKWRQVAPQARDLDQSKVDALLSVVTGAQAAALAEKAKTDKPDLTVAIKFDEGRKEDRVTFWRNGGNAYAHRAGDANAVTISGATMDAIVKALEGIK